MVIMESLQGRQPQLQVWVAMPKGKGNKVVINLQDSNNCLRIRIQITTDSQASLNALDYVKIYVSECVDTLSCLTEDNTMEP